jgi:branched-chain amino acid transport system permease protein
MANQRFSRLPTKVQLADSTNEMLENLIINGVVTGTFYALLALGIVVVHKATNVINFAHGEMFMMAAFIAYAAHVVVGLDYLASVIFAVIAAGALGALTFWVAFRPLLREGMVSILLAMVGLSFVLKGVARHYLGGRGDYLSFPPAISIEPIFIGPAVVTSQQILGLVAAIIALAVFTGFFKWTRAGKSMRATADNSRAAMLVGVRVDRVRMLTFAISAALAGVAAVLMAPLTLIYPDMGFGLFVKGLAAATLGGLSSPIGAVVAGIVVGVAEQLAAGYIYSGVQEISGFIIVMIALIFFPSGLFKLGPERRV